MAFTLEDGTGITDANALISAAEFQAFAADRGEDISAYSESDQEAAIVIASYDFIDTFYSFKGDELKTDQGMQLPTNDVEITKKIKLATYLAALLHLQGRLFVDPAEQNPQGQVTSADDSVGTLSTSRTYAEGYQLTTKYATGQIDRLLAQYTLNSGLGSVARW